MRATKPLHRFPSVDSHMLPTDAFFWYAAQAAPELRPLVAGLFMLDRAPDRDRFYASLQRLMAHMPRLRQRVAESPLRLGMPQWVDDPHFDLGYHVRDIMLPPPATPRHLMEFASTVFAVPLDPMRPLWEAYLVEGLEDGRAAYFLKVHHSIMDGAGAVALFDVFTQAGRTDPVRAPRPRAPRRPPTRDLGSALRATLQGAGAGFTAVLSAAGHLLQNPVQVASNLADAVQGLRTMARDFGAAEGKDPLAEQCSDIGRRLEGFSVSLPRLRQIKEALGVTLNDLVLTAVAGAVGRYHDQRGMHVETVQSMVPMNLRQEHEHDLPGNRVSVFRVALPVGERDPFSRLELIHQQTVVAKRSRGGSSNLYPLLMQAVGIVPAAAFRLLAQTINGRVGLICSNVPGPPMPRYLAGAKIDAVYPFAPVLLGIPLSIAMVSYGESFEVGIVADAGAIPDPVLLHRYFDETLDEIERRMTRRRRSRRTAAPQASAAG